ncbi:molecular chaperone HscC [Massilia sp. YIM B04103]|uniref:molecular chaperone HscC n=1 Tax=Massilia sp. YIM B04103 TaxID=2963106 RepID=UPI00210D8E7C|nr:molecular chaperone HscC [Massilia sp. YIM B04103]
MIVGIDLGTTNSLIAIWHNGEPKLIPNSLGEFLTPSCVSVDDDGTILIGKAARERLQTHPTHSAAVFKRHLGSNKQFTLAGRHFRAEELSALILRALKEDAEAAMGQPVTEAIITVPAYFSDAQRKATRAAGQLAGLKVERLLNEPTAAALAYGIHQRDKETQFLVFDLGGGTFDVSVLDLFEGVMEVRASAGDNFLGGEDFVNLLIDEFFKQASIPAALKQDGRFMQSLVAQTEQAKRKLSETPEVLLQIQHADTTYSMPLNEATLERISTPLLARLRSPVERALRDANLQTGSLDSIVLAGGATRMPVVRRMVARMFGRFPSCDINPDEVVALGAAVQAGLKMNDAALDEIVMTDVAPYSLGVAVSVNLGGDQHSHGHFDPVIERNTVVPVSRVKNYVPSSDKQTAIRIDIYQGEARMVRDNVGLGTIDVPISQAPGQFNGVDVRFTYDANGLLQVEATVLATQKTHTLVIEGNPGLLTQEEIQERFAALSELKIHPRDRIEFRTMLARGERLYQQLRGDAREEMGRRIRQFEQTLEKQDTKMLREAARMFSEVLEYFEQQSFLNLDA